jgi:catenin alpha
MYVYLCASTSSTTHKSTSTKMYRESSSSLSSIESFECSSLTPTGSLRKAVVDHVSDTFVATNVPLIALIDGARRGQIQLVEETAPVFMEHAMKLIEVANIVCSMSDSIEGIKLVRLAAKQIETLSPQVVNAARILAAHSTSKVALENMTAFRDTWEKHIRLLTEAVDEITTIEDFLAISENHILEDINLCIQAMVERNADRVDRTAGAIRGRTERVTDVVIAEMEKYETGEYTETVLESVRVLRDQIVPNFVEKINTTIEFLQMKSTQDDRKYEIMEQELIEVSSSVYHGIRDIRNSVLMNPVSCLK